MVDSSNSPNEELIQSKEEVDEFINTYWSSIEKINTYKQRKFFKKWAGRLGLGLFAVVVAISATTNLDIESNPVLTFSVVGLFIIASISLLLMAIFDILHSRTDLDSETVACHDLAGAFRAFLKSDEPDIETIELHLKEVQKHLRTPGFLSPLIAERIATSHRRGIINYIEGFLEASNKERELKETFPVFIELVSVTSALKDESRIDRLSREINSRPAETPTAKEGILRELSRAKSFLVNARVGIVVVGLALAGLSQPYIGIGGGLGLGAFVVTAYGVLRGI